MTAIRTRTASVNGIALDLLEAGPDDGPAIILAHGFPESSWSWRHQLPALAEAGVAPALGQIRLAGAPTAIWVDQFSNGESGPVFNRP